MENTTKSKPKLEVNSYYNESEILELGLIPMHILPIEHVMYEYDALVYFFARIGENSLRLISTTNKYSTTRS